MNNTRSSDRSTPTERVRNGKDGERGEGRDTKVKNIDRARGKREGEGKNRKQKTSHTSWFRLNAQNLHPGDSRRQFKVDCHETDILVFPTTTTTAWHLLFLELRRWCGVISESIGSASLGQSAASKLSGRKIRFFNPTH